jgi:hypothetical protein
MLCKALTHLLTAPSQYANLGQDEDVPWDHVYFFSVDENYVPMVPEQSGNTYGLECCALNGVFLTAHQSGDALSTLPSIDLIQHACFSL